MQRLPVRRLALLTVLSALCIGIQLTPRPPNVEFTSLIVFLVGASSGIVFGVSLPIIVMLVNGFLSPWGFSGLMLPFQIAGMIFTGVVGWLYGRAKGGIYDLSSWGEAAVLGAFLTVVYDIITNFGVALQYMLLGMPMLPAFITAIISGAPFSLVHVISNSFVFLTAFFPLIRVLQKFSGGEIVWKKRALHT